jgi:transposase-like protein
VINKSLDEGLKAFAERPSMRATRTILDARCEKVREAVIVSQAVLLRWRSTRP